MYTTYHFKSASEITTDIVEIIKTSFKSKPIKLTIEEDDDETSFLLNNQNNKQVLFQSIEEEKKGSSIKINIEK